LQQSGGCFQGAVAQSGQAESQAGRGVVVFDVFCQKEHELLT
jgi:hypothetical protein